MASTLDSRPSATTIDVEQLVGMAWSGKIRVPHFQRDFRWKWNDVQRLFDSIVRGYPIGSLLLWTRRATAQTVHLGALTIKAPRSGEAYWVVDGQQRLTSLANALHFDGQKSPTFAISYNLATEAFVRTPSIEEPSIVPLPVLFDLQGVLRWFARYPEIADRLDQATAITRRLRQFEVPAYLVNEDNTEVLQDIFDRMNNYGKRLSRAEVFAALNAGTEGEQSPTFERIASRIDADFQFGLIDNDTVLSAVLARRGPEVRRDIRNEFSRPNDEGRDAAYQAGEQALRQAVMFLQKDVGVPHISVLAYRYLLVVLARVFGLHPDPDARNLQLLRRWYWRAAIAGPEHFKGSTPNTARLLCAQVNTDLSASIQGLLASVKNSHRTGLDLKRFSTNEAETKMLLCTWWAKKPINPASREPFDQADLAENLIDQSTARLAIKYILPHSWVPTELRQWAAVRIMMPNVDFDSRELSGIFASRPAATEEEEWTRILHSHGMTSAMCAMLENGMYADFIQERQRHLEESANSFLRRMSEPEFEDTPPLTSLSLDEDEPDEGDSR